MTDEKTPRRCLAITAGGEQCKRHDVGPDDFCLVHSPARREEWEAIAARGRENAHAAIAAAVEERRTREPTHADDDCPQLERSLEGVTRFLGWIAVQVASGKMPPKQGSTATYALSTLRTALVARDLEGQLQAARAELAAFRASQRKGAA
jgi:hypothetical protein